VGAPPVGSSCAPGDSAQQTSGIDGLYLLTPFLLTRLRRRRR
jgi:hypothetical protein